MYAIVEIAGQQFKVERGTKVYVHRLEASEGAKIEFDNVLLIDNDGKIQIGTPSVDGAKVAATVLSHLKGDKVIVFKKKRRKGYQKSNGHRQQLSQILIQGILGKGETLKDEISVEKKAPKAKVEATEVEVKTTKKAAPKKAAAKTETAPKKAAPKKAAAKKAAK
ncbi:MAG: 50S ribosomal protein L21 [Bacteroidetes bacterium RIFCSPLOWO2_12_FULL_35_15]|nr:MAG: 50S ribosomal protein L21 [Bacteroidetes bacterium RIFCSPLOWO2_12_FULL_35_15]